MKFDEDFWLILWIASGFGALGGFAKYLDYRNKEKKKNPKFNERFFSAFLFSTMALGTIGAIAFVFFILELMPNTSIKMAVVYSLIAGVTGFKGLEMLWKIIIKNIAQKHYSIDITPIEETKRETE